MAKFESTLNHWGPSRVYSCAPVAITMKLQAVAFLFYFMTRSLIFFVLYLTNVYHFTQKPHFIMDRSNVKFQKCSCLPQFLTNQNSVTLLCSQSFCVLLVFSIFTESLSFSLRHTFHSFSLPNYDKNDIRAQKKTELCHFRFVVFFFSGVNRCEKNTWRW